MFKYQIVIHWQEEHLSREFNAEHCFLRSIILGNQIPVSVFLWLDGKSDLLATGVERKLAMFSNWSVLVLRGGGSCFC